MRSRAPRALRARSGFTVLELMISSTVFLLVAGAVVTSLVVPSALNMTNRETALASHAAQSIIEELKGTAFEEIFVRYNATEGDDPAAGSSPGDDFAVNGLDHQDGDGDGFVGSIEFPGAGKELREDGVDVELGLPRDLDGDGNVDAADHAGDYRILPVRIVVRWDGQNGERAFELITVLTNL